MRLLTLVLVAVLLGAATAQAAPPPNDDQENARPVAVGDRVEGTTVDATREEGESTGCGSSGPSVWYSLRGTGAQVVIDLRASGNLDASLEVYRVRRSRLISGVCENVNEDGFGRVDFTAAAGQRYLVRVAELSGSPSGSFRLSLPRPEPPESRPGTPLPARGVRRAVSSALDREDLWSVRLTEGTTYRVALVSSAAGCRSLSIRPAEGSGPGEDAFCDSYLLFTPGPGESGVYTIAVGAQERQRGLQRYRLQVAEARADDLYPGIRLRERRATRGRLDAGRIDAVDTYRFDVLRRSELLLRLRAPERVSMTLRREAGGSIGRSEGTLRGRIRPGRYVLTLRAPEGVAGGYRLRRALRTITATRLSLAGRRRARARAGQTVAVGVRVPPGATGPVTVVFERFDPATGWRFDSRKRLRVRDGIVTSSYRPPALGRYRARAFFAGTRVAADSESGYARLVVVEPLGTDA